MGRSQPSILRTNAPDDLAFRVLLAFVQAESGDSEGAQEALALDTFVVPEHGYGPDRAAAWPLIQHCLAACAYRLCDETLAHRALTALEPHSDLVLRVQGALAVGAGARSLGLCHLVLGEANEAVADLEHALTLEEGLGALPHTVRTRVALANALDAANRDGARARALRASAYDDHEPRDERRHRGVRQPAKLIRVPAAGLSYSVPEPPSVRRRS